MKRDVLSEIRSDSDKLVFLVLAMTYIVFFVRICMMWKRKSKICREIQLKVAWLSKVVSIWENDCNVEL